MTRMSHIPAKRRAVFQVLDTLVAEGKKRGLGAEEAGYAASDRQIAVLVTERFGFAIHHSTVSDARALYFSTEVAAREEQERQRERFSFSGELWGNLSRIDTSRRLEALAVGGELDKLLDPKKVCLPSLPNESGTFNFGNEVWRAKADAAGTASMLAAQLDALVSDQQSPGGVDPEAQKRAIFETCDAIVAASS